MVPRGRLDRLSWIFVSQTVYQRFDISKLRQLTYRVQSTMPEISRYLGVTIYMRYRDHPPSHFHVHYAEHRAIIAVETMQILEGHLPGRVYGLVAEWGLRHRALLRENWRRAVAREPL